MKFDERLALVKKHREDNGLKVMIIGLGSVGSYLLDYLSSLNDERLTIIVAGRSREKMESTVNIIKIASAIRRKNKSEIIIADGIDLEDVGSIARCLNTYEPDIIVNTSRVYSGLKYGSISWKKVRAYGIWTPLSIRYIRNIMMAYRDSGCKAVVINSSYSDATIPWLKSAGLPYPDFGSGNLNHLLPRIKFAVASILGKDDFWNIDAVLATAHFHDVVISKEGHSEGVEQLLSLSYKGEKLQLNQDDIFLKCNLPTPTDAKRNMMNASSNFEIIEILIKAMDEGICERIHSPGALGEIGGYPVLLDFTDGKAHAEIDTTVFSLDEMRRKNRESLALDGVEDIRNACLIYTDELLAKVRKEFGASLPKTVSFDDIDDTAQKIIDTIIVPTIEKR